MTEFVVIIHPRGAWDTDEIRYHYVSTLETATAIAEAQRDLGFTADIYQRRK